MENLDKYWVYDIESYPNVFTLCVKNVASEVCHTFEISERCNQSADIIQFILDIRVDCYMVGFNNIGYDYPMLHRLLKMGATEGVGTANYLNQLSKDIFSSNNSWDNTVNKDDWWIYQIDLFRINHFDNKNRSVSLKYLEFVMRATSIKDLPFDPKLPVPVNNIDALIYYNKHDVDWTIEFFKLNFKKINFRYAISDKYNYDFVNHNDTKIGKDYFKQILKRGGFNTNTNTPRQSVNFKDIITITQDRFITPSVKNFIKCLSKVEVGISENKQRPKTSPASVCKFDITDTTHKNPDLLLPKKVGEVRAIGFNIDGLDYKIGSGGIHASVDNKIIITDTDTVIHDMDVTSYYPSIFITQGFYPEHLGVEFLSIYKELKAERLLYDKGTPENSMLKLALNGVFGDTNNQYSTFYDIVCMLRVTINGQLLVTLLIERLLPYCEVLQANTDGITIKYNSNDKLKIQTVYKQWEAETKLSLEHNLYSKMVIRDVNNYIAIYENGDVKSKGCYNSVKEWHQQSSALVVSKVAFDFLTQGIDFRQRLLNHKDLYDFMLCIKVNKNSKLVIDKDGKETIIQNTTRYYMSKSGGKMIKIMPPLPKKPDIWRRFVQHSGMGVKVCNDDKNINVDDINYEYYGQEVLKLIGIF